MIIRKYRAKRWTKKIIKKNNLQKQPLDCSQYIHPTDQAALSVLKKIPLFDTVCNKILSFLNEPQCRIYDMSSKLRITPTQFSKIYYMVESICHKIGIDMPDLYLVRNREPNAYTYGTKHFSITIHSGLIECMEDDEIYAVLAHECGHIACNHVLYHTIGRFILSGGFIGLQKLNGVIKNSLVGSIVTLTIESSLELAFSYWQRCSELSADRVAIMCCESEKPVIETMMRLAGGTTHVDAEIDRDLFIAQANEYKKLTAENKIDKALEYFLIHNQTHPLLAVRAYEANEWTKSKEFANCLKECM